MFNKLRILFPLFIAILFISSCQKDPDNQPNPENPNLEIYLIDCPIEAEAINMEIEEVIIIGDGQEFKIEPELEGMFNLLDYQNGVNALLISENIDLSTVNSISLTLGDDINIIVAGVEHELELPEAFEDGMTLNTNVVVQDGSVTELTIDFDACESIVRSSDGEYVLRPHLNLFDDEGDDIDDNDDDGNEDDEDDDDEIDFDDISEEVEDYLAATIDSNSFIVDVKEVELCDEYLVYIIYIVDLNDVESMIVIDESGDTNIQFAFMDPTNMMTAISDYMNANHPDMAIDNAISITTPDGSLFYNLEVENTSDDDDEVELIFNADGEWVCTLED